MSPVKLPHNHKILSNNKDHWITTYTGKQFHIFEPEIDEICIEDIAHALSLICRYGGHLSEHYSVAQHSVVVSLLVDESISLEALMHDSPKTYIGDMVKPLKRHPSMTIFSIIDRKIEKKIEEKFELFQHLSIEEQSEARRLISEADNITLLTEKRDLFSINQVWLDNIQVKNCNASAIKFFKITNMHYRHAEQIFLKRFNELWQRRQELKQKNAQK